MENNFIAMDVETANSQRSSICSIGLVKFENGEIVDTFYSLINPEESFDEINISIHNITPEMVVTAPNYINIRPIIIDFIDNYPVVCHYAAFDTGVIRAANDKYNITNFEFEYLCTYQLSKALLTRLSYKLSMLCKEFNINFMHHDALEDARACGNLLIKLCDLNECSNYHELAEQAGYKKLGHVKEIDFTGFRKYKTKKNVDILSQLHEGNPEHFNTENEFYKKNVVFTGTLISMVRREAMQLIKNIGGIPQKGLTRDTNYLIMGEQDLRVLDSSGKSSKLKKAEQYLLDGKNIELLGENDFLKLLEDKDD
ncbi:exonuclease domain-containing protein [Carnobacterium divergens]|uniref:exonuclease domain-containing protein n=1 Tax=Carnobacterium divergens TaxID=2748 RepID=UPI00288CC4BA|nr:exonuclease domain-containing protein [Carnobacterium divergens]MDT2011223.1 exonuclease domain-containing protein [Carnobacterium divergens]